MSESMTEERLAELAKHAREMTILGEGRVLSELVIEVQEQRNKNDNQYRIIRELRDKIQDRDDENRRLIERVRRLRADQLEERRSAENIQHRLARENERLRRERDEQAGYIRNLQDENRELRNRISGMAVRPSPEPLRIDLQEKLAHAEMMRDRAERQRASAVSAHNRAEQQRASATTAYNNAQKELKEAKEDFQTLEKAKRAIERALANAVRQRDELQRSLATVKAELENVNHALRQTREQRDSLKAEAEDHSPEAIARALDRVLMRSSFGASLASIVFERDWVVTDWTVDHRQDCLSVNVVFGRDRSGQNG